MISRMLYRNLSLICVTLTALLFTFSCKKLPDPAFSYEPMENPEAGETIRFSNETDKAVSFSWDFGDGGSSTLTNPEHIFQAAGIYGVKLAAFNEDGEESVVESVTINEPTVLGFTVYDTTGVNILTGADVWIYDNEYDLENLNDPLFEDITDQNGDVIFRNLEPMVYYFLAFKESAGGMWLFAYSTPVLDQNQENLFYFMCQWFPDAKKGTLDLKSHRVLPDGGNSRQLSPAHR